ncbi:MAG: hypothetical protein EOP54_05735 [Sphingobacteriales bacterium]|nr:MAG: hypothetical protein EOP54_05735 [Sphingobacteriales bacterium]
MGFLIYVLQRLEVNLPRWINNYVNDFLCIPIVLGTITYLFGCFKRQRDLTFSLTFALILALYYSLYFELYLPQVNPRYTSDIFDVLLYFSGAVFYYYCQA